jgi:hypothetical protein
VLSYPALEEPPKGEALPAGTANADAVYRATIRRLERWALPSALHDGAGLTVRAENYFRDGVIDVTAWDPRKLSLMLVRDYLEEWHHQARVVDAFARAKLRRNIYVEGLARNGHMSRLGLRAAILALYAAFYHRILMLRKQRWIKDAELRRVTLSMLAPHRSPMEGTHLAFPTVPGMPLAPFVPLRRLEAEPRPWPLPPERPMTAAETRLWNEVNQVMGRILGGRRAAASS